MATILSRVVGNLSVGHQRSGSERREQTKRWAGGGSHSEEPRGFLAQGPSRGLQTTRLAWSPACLHSTAMEPEGWRPRAKSVNPDPPRHGWRPSREMLNIVIWGRPGVRPGLSILDTGGTEGGRMGSNPTENPTATRSARTRTRRRVLGDSGARRGRGRFDHEA